VAPHPKPHERLVLSTGTIWFVPDKSVRQFHNADFRAAAELKLGVIVDPFHLRNKQQVYVNIARACAIQKLRGFDNYRYRLVDFVEPHGQHAMAAAERKDRQRLGVTPTR
jgi:hypothetical protein